MKKKTTRVAKQAKATTPFENLPKEERHNMLANGLAGAILGGFPGLGIGGGINPFNTFGGIGTSLNQTDTLFINNRWYFLSNFRQEVSQSYCEHGLFQTVVDVPVEDAFRGGIEIESKQVEPIQIERINAIIDRENDLGVLAQACKWDRLFGGAGDLIITDQPPNLPLNVEALYRRQLEFRAVDMWELFWSEQNLDSVYNPELQETEYEFYNYYARQVHFSRVMKLKGIEAPSFLRPRLRGWGLSVLEPVVADVNQYFKSQNLIFELLDQFKVDVYKLKNLTSTLLQQGGEEKVRRRVQLANQQKNFQSAIVMDGEDDWAQKEILFTGIKETLEGIRMQVASSLRMPVSKIFGTSATGFGSGQDDIENYNMMVEALRQKVKYDALRIVELRFQQEYGYIPDDLAIKFKPLRILSAEQEENVKSQKFNRVLAARQAGEMTTKEFRDACNKELLLEIQLDTDDAALGEIEEEQDAMAEQANPEGGGEEKVEVKKAPKPKTLTPEVRS